MSFGDQNLKRNTGVIRQRLDSTAIHKTRELDGTLTEDTIRLDVVARKLSIQIDSGLTVNDPEGSIDGKEFFTLGTPASGRLSYGTGASDHLIKWVRFTRTAGNGKATVIAVP